MAVSETPPAQWHGRASLSGARAPAYRYPEGCAANGQVRCQRNARGCLSKLEATPPHGKIVVTIKSPVGDISVVTLIRTDTTLDHSQKAEKVCLVTATLKHPRCTHLAWPSISRHAPSVCAATWAAGEVECRWEPRLPQKLRKSH